MSNKKFDVKQEAITVTSSRNY